MRVILAFILMCSPAWAKTYRVNVTYRVCKQNSACDYGKFSMTGFAIGMKDGKEVVCSAGHGFPESSRGFTIDAKGSTIDGQPAHLLGWSHYPSGCDFSLWTVDLKDPDFLPLGDSPSPGDKVSFDGVYSDGEGTITSTEPWVKWSGDHPVHGDSGSPLVSGGNVVGIVIGYDASHGMACNVKKLIRLLEIRPGVELFAQAAPPPPAEVEPDIPPVEGFPPIVSMPITRDGGQEQGQDASLTAPGVLWSLTSKALPWVLGPVGGAAAALGVPLLWRLFRRKKERLRPLPRRDLAEARELVQLGRLEGRDPLLDATRWLFADDEIENTPPQERDVLERFRRRVNARAESVAPLEYSRN